MKLKFKNAQKAVCSAPAGHQRAVNGGLAFPEGYKAPSF